MTEPNLRRFINDVTKKNVSKCQKTTLTYVHNFDRGSEIAYSEGRNFSGIGFTGLKHMKTGKWIYRNIMMGLELGSLG